ncbi:MAG: phosphotransferase [Anaerolineae bacterium]|nr:phosphotransferase [Anaerolineae bacterium]
MLPELDIEQPAALLAYLRAGGWIEAQEAPRMTVLSGGVSCRTVLVERASGEGWVVKQALAQLRVKVDWFTSPERIHREALSIAVLAPLCPPGSVPRLIFEDLPHYLMAMEAVPQPHANWKQRLLAGDLQTDHVRQFARLLATIHRETGLRRDALMAEFGDRTFYESLRLEAYYHYSGTQVPEAAAFYAALIAATRARQDTLVHGDYSPKNVLVHHGQLVLLDYEVAHMGEPAFDLGFSLTHLLSKAHHLPAMRREFSAAALLYWQTYRAAIGDAPWADGLEARAVRHTLGCLLARVAGRSPLEYLDAGEWARQRAAAVALMADPPASVEALIAGFVSRIQA